MSLELVDRPFADLTVKWASSMMYVKPRNPADDLRLACATLSESWRTNLIQRATRGKAIDTGKRLFGKSS